MGVRHTAKLGKHLEPYIYGLVTLYLLLFIQKYCVLQEVGCNILLQEVEVDEPLALYWIFSSSVPKPLVKRKTAYNICIFGDPVK